MLNAVPENINAMTRAVIQNHPNAYNCQCYRKILNRDNPKMLGGMMVLDSEDEEDFEFEFIGNGYALQAEPFQPSQMMDNQDANNSYAVQIPFLVVQEQAYDFTLKKHDMVLLLLDMGNIKLAWEVIGIETVINIPPFTKRYLMNQRAELNIVSRH